MSKETHELPAMAGAIADTDEILVSAPGEPKRNVRAAFTKLQTYFGLKKIFRANAALDFPSITTDNFADLTVSVPGAAVGDAAFAAARSAPGSIGFEAWVSAPDTVTVRAQNATAGSVNLASITFDVIVFKA